MLRTFNWEMFRNERGACGSRCSSMSVSGKEKAVEKLVWFSGESPEGHPYWESGDAAWAKDLSRFRLAGEEPGEDVGRCCGDLSDRRTASASPWSKIICDHRSLCMRVRGDI